jgi:hypothetical protein
MKRLFLVFLFIGIALLYFGCSENNPIISELSQSGQVTSTLAKKPLPTLTGTIDLDFLPPGTTPPYFWVGTITFGTETYGVRYKSVGDPPPPPPRAFVFDERFEIWDEGFNTLYLEGPDAGVVPCGNNTFVANGKVEIANGPFEMWRGRNVHTSGIITWVIPCVFPLGATGTFRIN